MKAFLKFIAAQLGRHRRPVAMCASLSVAAALMDMAAPIAMGRGIDLAAGRASVVLFGGAILAWFAIRALADWLRVRIWVNGSRIASIVSTDYVMKAMSTLLDKPLSYHYGQKMHEVGEKLGTFRWDLRNFIDGSVFDLGPAILAITAIIAYLFAIDWRVALVMVLSVAAYILFTRSVMPRLMTAREAWNEADSKLASIGWDALRNILVVKSTTNEDLVRRRLDEKWKILWKTELDNDRTDSRMNNGQNLIIGLASFGILVLGASDLSAGRMTAGQLASLIAYTFMVFGYIRYTQWSMRMFLRASADFRMLEPELASAAEDIAGGRAHGINGEVEFRDVRFRYREDRPILEDVSFKVPAGGSVAVVGESGEGKTTIVDLLGRYYEPQSGAILIDGADIREINLRSLRSQMAYVPQDLTLFHESIGFNIRYGRPDASDEDVRLAARRAALDDFIEKLPEKYETVVGERGLKLSGGERQRVALARAFLRDPRIIILDEPTAHLDSRTEEAIRGSLRELMRGRTTFIIAHRLRTVAEADIILVLKEGRIVQTGRHEDLVKDRGGVYFQLLKAQGMVFPDEG